MGRMTEEAKKREELMVRGSSDITPQQRLIAQFDKAWPRMSQSLSNAVSSERMYQLIVSTINRNPKLAECTPETVLSCFMRCATLGLEPSDVDGLGRAYILPFYNGKKKHMEATFIIGYKGLIDLARRSGKIRDISARAVYEGDVFDFEYGLNETLRHIPGDGARTPDKMTHVYCIVHFTDGGHYIDVMTRNEVEAIRKRSKSPDRGPWVSDYEAMAKKTVIRRAQPYLPLSTQVQRAVAADETTGGFADILSRRPIFEEEGINGGSEGPAVDIAEPVQPAHEQEIQQNSSYGEEEAGIQFAACSTCGNMREVATGLTQAQLNQFLCCENPDYQYV